MMDASANTSALIFRSSVISGVATSLIISDIVLGLKYWPFVDGVRLIRVLKTFGGRGSSLMFMKVKLLPKFTSGPKSAWPIKGSKRLVTVILMISPILGSPCKGSVTSKMHMIELYLLYA